MVRYGSKEWCREIAIRMAVDWVSTGRATLTTSTRIGRYAKMNKMTTEQIIEIARQRISA